MKFIFEKLRSLSKGTWLRTILQILAYVNQFLIMIGQSPWGQDPIYIWVSFGVTVLITILSYWYNNDWSKLAQSTSRIFDMVKDGKITKEEINEFINEHKGVNDDPNDL